MARGHAAHLPRRGTRRRQDVRDAQRGSAPPRPRHRRRRRLRRDPRPPEDRGADRRPRGRSAAEARVSRQRRSRRWTSTRSSPASPTQVLVDELAHTNVPGSRNEKRWQDVEELLDAGHRRDLDVQHPAPRVGQRRRRTHHRRRAARDDPRRDRAARPTRSSSSTCRPRRCGAAWRTATSTSRRRSTPRSANYFRPGNLAALRELALLWVADRVDEALEEYRERHGITEPWETRERVLVAITGAPGTEALIRRAARMAQRAHGELLGLHVTTADGLAGPRSENLARHRTAARRPRWRVPRGRRERRRRRARGVRTRRELHPARARREPAVALDRARPRVGHQPHRAPRGPDRRARDLPRTGRTRRRRSPAPAPRRAGDRRCRVAGRSRGWLLAAIGLPLLTLLLVQVRDDVGLETVLLLFLSLVVAVGAIGGILPGLAAAVVGFLLANWYFTPPIHTWTISEGENFVALIVFVVVSAVVSGLVDLAARRALEGQASARRGRDPGAPHRRCIEPDDPLHALVASCARRSGSTRSRVMSRTDGTAGPSKRPTATRSPTSPDGDARRRRGHRRRTSCSCSSGRRSTADDRQVLNAFAAQLAAVRERARLSAEAATAIGARPGERAARRAAASRVARSADTARVDQGRRVEPAPARRRRGATTDVAEFLATIEDEADRLNALVGNLLDMSRLQAGVIEPDASASCISRKSCRPRSRASATAPAASRPTSRSRCRRSQGDAALLERVIANLVENALKWSPPEAPVRVEAGAVQDRVDAPRRRPRSRHPRRRARPCLPAVPTARRSRPRRPASVSASRSRAASSTRWAASSSSTTHPAAARRRS